MTQLSRILCAVDFSWPAQAAFEQALALSQAQNAELTVVHAVPLDKPFRWRACRRIAAISKLHRAAEAKGVRLSVTEQHGDPAGVIVLHANARSFDARPFDLVVLGTHQRTGLERFRLGSVAERVAQRVVCPVLIVPTLERDADHPASSSFRNVLCPVDFTPASNAALAQALPIVQRAGGRLTQLHVLQGVSPASSRYASHFTVPEYRHLVTRDALQRMQTTIPAARASGMVHTRVVTGTPSDEIVRVAAEVRADLIVMGVTSRSAIGRWLFGSTATRVMRRAPCSVLVVPALKQSRQLQRSAIDSTTKVAA